MSTLTSIMGRMAAYSGKNVTQDQALNSTINLMPENLSWDALPPSVPNDNYEYAIPIPGQWKLS